MEFVDNLNILGVEVKEIPCLLGHGAPTSKTVGVVGLFYKDKDDDKGGLYLCVAALNNTYAWIKLMTPIMSGELNMNSNSVTNVNLISLVSPITGETGYMALAESGQLMFADENGAVRLSGIADGIEDYDVATMKQLREQAQGVLLITVESGMASVLPSYIVEQLEKGVIPILKIEGDYAYLKSYSINPHTVFFEKYTIESNKVSVTRYTIGTNGKISEKSVNALDGVESALDAIIDIQNSLIGGNDGDMISFTIGRKSYSVPQGKTWEEIVQEELITQLCDICESGERLLSVSGSYLELDTCPVCGSTGSPGYLSMDNTEDEATGPIAVHPESYPIANYSYYFYPH